MEHERLRQSLLYVLLFMKKIDNKRLFGILMLQKV